MSKAKLQGNKWNLEGAKGGEVEIAVKKMMESVYIYKCNDITIHVKGKANAIAVDNCTNCNVTFDTIISAVEVTKSRKIKLQVNEKAFVPTIQVESTDGISVYLSDDCVKSPDFNVTASTSTEMNIEFMLNGEKIEKALPQQFVYQLDVSSGAPKINTRVSDLYTG